jgi:HD-GYP domain-containing protein (c-di-GMP phosphodiesterase class II)
MGLEERIMKMVRCHHEDFDGSGYPAGLAGEEIPVEARIVNVIDAFRALITPGPYRRCFSLDEARSEIIRGSGTKFDPKVVGAFVKSLHALGAVEDSCELVLTAVEREDGTDDGPVVERGENDSPEDEPTFELNDDDNIHIEVPVKEEAT